MVVTEEVSQPLKSWSKAALEENRLEKSVSLDTSHVATGPYGDVVQSAAVIAVSSSARVEMNA